MKTQIKQRSDLFYGAWIYAVTFQMTEAACLREWKSQLKINAAIERRKEIEKFRSMSSSRYTGHTVPFTVFSTKVVADLNDLGSYLRSKIDQFKLVITPGQVYVYTNDVSIVQYLYGHYNQQPGFGVTEANVSFSKDTIVLKNVPKFKYRTFFKECAMSTNIKDVLSNWINGMGEEVRPSPSLKYWLSYRNSGRVWYRDTHLASHYYVEHNDVKLDTWMAIVCPGAIRKTMQVVQAAINN